VVLAPSGKQVEIAFGEQRAVLVGVRGGLRSYAIAGSHLIDGYGIASLAEPMTCPPNAFKSGDDLIVLEPGGSFLGVWGIGRL
jgi:hypothetical protein